MVNLHNSITIIYIHNIQRYVLRNWPIYHQDIWIEFDCKRFNKWTSITGKSIFYCNECNRSVLCLGITFEYKMFINALLCMFIVLNVESVQCLVCEWVCASEIPFLWWLMRPKIKIIIYRIFLFNMFKYATAKGEKKNKWKY